MACDDAGLKRVYILPGWIIGIAGAQHYKLPSRAPRILNSYFCPSLSHPVFELYGITKPIASTS